MKSDCIDEFNENSGDNFSSKFEIRLIDNVAKIRSDIGCSDEHIDYNKFYEYIRLQITTLPKYIDEVEIYAMTSCDLSIDDTDGGETDPLTWLPNHIKKLKVRCEDSCDYIYNDGKLPESLEVLDVDYPYDPTYFLSDIPKSVHTVFWGSSMHGIGYDLSTMPSHVKNINIFNKESVIN